MKIYLRPIHLDDGNLIVKWRNSPSVSKHCFNRTPISLESNQQFYEQYVKTQIYYQYIVERIDEAFGMISYPIATVYLKDIDKINRRCELCIFTSDDEEWNSDSQSIAIQMLLEKAFRELHMHKVYTYVFSVFEDEKDLMLKAGFHQEAELKAEALSPSGDYWDAYRMAIFASDYSAGRD